MSDARSRQRWLSSVSLGPVFSNDSKSVSVPQRLGALVLTVVLVAAFAWIIIPAGHGAGPIGYLMVLGTFSAWGLPLVFGWGGITLLLLAVFCSTASFHASLTIAGLVCIVISWSFFILASEMFRPTLLMSIPFLLLCILRGTQSIILMRRRKA